MSKTTEVSQIEGSLIIDYVAICDRCANKITHEEDDPKGFADELHKDGWRVFENGMSCELLCHDCYTIRIDQQ
jgi:hypothetical protein